MTQVPRLGRLIGTLRTPSSAADRRGGAASPASAPAQARSSETSGHEALRERMRTDVAQRLRHVDFATESGRRQAVRAFLETVLYRQFGEGLVQSPRFVEIIGQVQQLLEGDTQVNADLLALLVELQQRGGA